MEKTVNFFDGRLILKSLSDEERRKNLLSDYGKITGGVDSQIFFDNTHTCFSFFAPEMHYARFFLFDGQRYAAFHEGELHTVDGKELYCPRHIDLTDAYNSEKRNPMYWRREIKNVALILVAMEAQMRVGNISRIKTQETGFSRVAASTYSELGYTEISGQHSQNYEKNLTEDNFVLPRVLRGVNKNVK